MPRPALLALLAAVLLEVSPLPPAAAAPADAPALAPALAAEREALERDPDAPVLGNPEGRVTVVEFTDYNCAACRAVQPAARDLLATDPDVRLVVREWPVEGAASEAAARAALAAWLQGRGAFAALHGALPSLDAPADERPAVVLAQVLGLDHGRLRRDMDAPEVEAHLAASRRLAAALGLAEPPAFVVGDRLLAGAVTGGELRAAVAAAREAATP